MYYLIGTTFKTNNLKIIAQLMLKWANVANSLWISAKKFSTSGTMQHILVNTERGTALKTKLIFSSFTHTHTPLFFLISSLILILLLKAINFINERLNNENTLHLAAFIWELYVRNLCQKRFLYSQQASPQNWKFNIIHKIILLFMFMYYTHGMAWHPTYMCVGDSI